VAEPARVPPADQREQGGGVLRERRGAHVRVHRGRTRQQCIERSGTARIAIGRPTADHSE